MTHPLDAIAWSALTGRQTRFAEGDGAARRFAPEVSVFAGWDPSVPAADGWAALAEVLGDEPAAVALGAVDAPAGWDVLRRLEGHLMVAEAIDFDGDDELQPLGEADAADMAALVERTHPGPWAPGTWRIGGYLGLRLEGRLVAMAGERMQPAGWTEVSAVCTHPDFQGRGLGARLTRAVTAQILARGEGAFLHVIGTNDTAIRLYERLGYARRRPAVVAVVARRKDDGR